MRRNNTPGSFCVGLLALVCGQPALAAGCPREWPAWADFATRWVQSDGRVLESSLEANHSTSEGQAYALFFALVANDRDRFARIWRWSRENLAGDAPGRMLPAWLWGQGADGHWQVQDANAASDADLWFAYALLEADRLWGMPAYRADAEALLEQIREKEVVSIPGLGAMLLPGPVGFAQPDHLWRLNPSYLPLPLLRRLAAVQPQGPWHEMANGTARLIQETSANGYAVDWAGYRATSADAGLFVDDPFKGDMGSYDAIRVYLWAGATDAGDPLAKPILDALQGISRATGSSGIPPEKVATQRGTVSGDGPFGFSAALVPYFETMKQPWLAEVQRRRAQEGLNKALGERDAGGAPVYYDFMLSLFGLGWADHYYRFSADGKLVPFWESACAAAR